MFLSLGAYPFAQIWIPIQIHQYTEIIIRFQKRPNDTRIILDQRVFVSLLILRFYACIGISNIKERFHRCKI